MPVSGPGWMQDPEDQSQLRYWTGSIWSEYRLPRPDGWTTSPTGVARQGTLPWWQTWWFVIPGLVFCLPIGLVGLWRRPGLTTAWRVVGTVASAALLIAVLVSPDSTTTDEGDTAADSTSTQSSPSSAPSAAEPADVSVPDVASLKRREAVSQLRRAGFTIGEISRVPSGRRTGSVLQQSPSSGSFAAAGSTVLLVLAAPFPRVPSTIGLNVRAARRVLRQAGFVVITTRRVTSSGPDRAVLRQVPRVGSRVKPGSTVQLVIADFVPPPPPPEPVAPPADNCTTGYDPCLPPNSDYDCAGGSGDGPGYADGPIYITGSDPYELDNDGDGVACED